MREIIYVWNYREWGGAQIYFLSLMKEAKGSYRVTALLPSDSEPKLLQYLKSLKIPIEFLPPSPKLDTAGGLTAKMSRRLAILRSEFCLVVNILARDNPRDMIVHIDLGFWQSALALFKLSRKTNVFVTVHTGLPFYTGWRALRWKIKGNILSRFSSFHILASNKEAKDSLKPYIGADKFDLVEVTYSGIDPTEIERVTGDRPDKTEIRQRYGLPESVPILMTVGQFIERKGCWVLLESLKQLKGAGKEFTFIWLSTTLPDAETLNRINEYGLGDSFLIMDADQIGETRDDLLTLLSVADIFILASLQEGLPIALIEAMALGLPCIATNVNAIPEAIEDGLNGTLVPPNDPIQLREAIRTLLNDPQQRGVFGDAAKKTAFDKFNAKITAERTLKLYDDLWKTAP